MAWGRGEASAFDDLMPLVHDELKRLARRHMNRERPGQTMQATALVNEAYLRLIGITQVRWQNRAHFFAMASRVMRESSWIPRGRAGIKYGVFSFPSG